MQVNMLEAKTQLSRLVEAALRGEEVVIANRGKAVVKLVKADAPPIKRVAGAWEGLMTEEQIDDAFSPEVQAELARPIEAGLKAKPREKKATPRATTTKPRRAR